MGKYFISFATLGTFGNMYVSYDDKEVITQDDIEEWEKHIRESIGGKGAVVLYFKKL
jgi:hypothetical protein